MQQLLLKMHRKVKTKIHQVSQIIKRDKRRAEQFFWKSELENYLLWYNGKKELYGFRCPNEDEKIKVSHSDIVNACLTWNELFQQKKYLIDLQLDENVFKGERVCDIGCGPHPSALVFKDCEIYGVDPLTCYYKKIGYPQEGYYPSRYHFVCATSESTGFPDRYFDAVISVNAIDHVDCIYTTSMEIKRILKPNGKFRMHVHYHKPTITEPIELNDEIFFRIFGWVNGLKKVSESVFKDMGLTKAKEGELFVVWSNF